MNKLLLVFGTRPEAIKMAPVIMALKKYPDKFRVIVCVTAQHRQMLDQVLNLFEIRPDYDLDIMKSEQDLYDVTANVLTGLRSVIREEQPDIVVVQGDTTTTMAASLAAFYARIRVAHIEAGLRTNNRFSPYPEEINRRMTTLLADLHFAPTEKNRLNLLSEGIPAKSIWVTGNTVIDALLHINSILESSNGLLQEVEGRFSFLNPEKKLILVTGHRRENFGEGFEKICISLKDIARLYTNVEILYPVHLNPNVQEPVRKLLGNHTNIHLIEPVDYLPFVYLMKRSFMIITDSGGVQEEAPTFGKPVLVLRNTTERLEVLNSGNVKLVGTDSGRITAEVKRCLMDTEAYRKMSVAHNPYGDGKAAERIIAQLSSL